MITIKSEKNIEVMKEGGRRLARIMSNLTSKAKPGVSTMELDKLAEKLVFSMEGKPSFKGYPDPSGKKFPATICASVNNQVVHGVPLEEEKLREGDVLKIDIGMEYRGFHTDMARSIAIGKCSGRARTLIKVTEESFWKGIKKLKAGGNLSEYSKAVQKYVESRGFSVIRNLVGHGIGKEVHEDPQIPNYYTKKYRDVKLGPGMALALEPMVNVGGYETILDKDGWTFKTKDGSLSAHYENTIAITDRGVEVLTT